MSLAPIRAYATETHSARRRLGPVNSSDQMMRMISVVAIGTALALVFAVLAPIGA